MLFKKLYVNKHIEDVALGGRGTIAKELAEKLSLAIFENMTLSKTSKKDIVEVSCFVSMNDNRDEWRDRKDKVIYDHNPFNCDSCVSKDQCEIFSFIRRKYPIDETETFGCFNWKKIKENT